MADLIIPSPLYQFYAICVDDTIPHKLNPEAWIKQDKWYKVKHFVERTLNNDGSEAVTITDKNNVEIHPTPSMWSFTLKRFKIIKICLN